MWVARTNAWFPRAMSNCVRCDGMLSLFYSKQCIMKQLLVSVLALCGIVKVEVSVVT